MRRATAAPHAALVAAVALAAPLAAQRPVPSPHPGRRGAASAPVREPERAHLAPAAVVREFYAFHFRHHMAFTRDAVRVRSRWFAPDLYGRIRAYFAPPGKPDEVPAIDGDPFTDSQEYPRTFRVGSARVRGDTAHVSVTLVWREGDRRPVSVVLVPVRGAWRIADVRYAEGPSLRALLVARN